MRIAMLVIRLRWSLTWAYLRKSSWQTIGFIVGIVVALACIVGVGRGAWEIGSLVSEHSDVNGVSSLLIMNTVMVVGGTFAFLMTIILQLMLFGQGSTLSADRFEIFGIRDRDLQFGLTLSGLCGVPGITSLAVAFLISLIYRSFGLPTVVVSLIAAPCAVITIVSLSRLIMSAASTLLQSKRSQSMLYIAIILIFILVANTPNIVINSFGIQKLQLGWFTGFSNVLGWTPFGAAFQLPFDALTGNWLMALVRVLILFLTWCLCFMASMWLMRRERMVAGAAEKVVLSKGIGSFSWMPDSVSGAVSARYLTYLLRDPRQAMVLLMPVIFLGLFSLQSGTLSEMVFAAPLMSAMFMMMPESNGLAYDGMGMTMHVQMGVRGIDDRIGRARVLAVLGAIYMLLIGAVSLVVYNLRDGQYMMIGTVCALCAVGMYLASVGVAEVCSCMFMYPVASLKKPFSSPQGRALSQGFLPFIPMLATGLVMTPTAVTIIVLAVLSGMGFLWIAIPVALVNGLLVLWLGVVLGGRIMDARQLKIVATLNHFAQLQR
ncbi:ABC transporter permease [Bifidobacterium aquikefiricola]|uniref:ABC transporter permease n=1 Tax=Bifidobacterium aquikefiricola TaxID=3059038 RepID=A0AB39U8A1_9BIFI